MVKPSQSHVTIVTSAFDLAHRIATAYKDAYVEGIVSKRTDSLYRSGASENLAQVEEPGDRCSAPVARRGVALGPSDPGLDDVVHTETAT